MTDSVEIVVRDTPEKFRDMAEEIVRPLLELLWERNELEREIFTRSRELEAEKLAKGISRNQAVPEEQALWEEFARRYMELVEPRCLPGLLKYGAARSFGKPARYDHLFEAEEPQVVFTMKSAKKAVVMTLARKSTDTRYRFTLRPSEDGWKTGGVDYAFGTSQEEWHADSSL